VVEGIPVLFRDPARVDAFGLLATLEPVDAVSALASGGPDDAPLPHLLAQLSTYLGTWESGAEALLEKLRALPRVGSLVELGCGVGRSLLELSGRADVAVGLDRSGGLLRVARRLLRGEEVRYARRMAGRTYVADAVRGARADGVQLVCADALEPPFAPGSFDRVVALNLLDNVPSPRALLHHLHQLAAPGGEVVVSSPYSWRDGIVDSAERLPGPDPAAALREEVRALGWRIVDDCEVPWTLRHDARASTTWRVHFLRAHRPTS
jgi:SAM-dependent methyltransferase